MEHVAQFSRVLMLFSPAETALALSHRGGEQSSGAFPRRAATPAGSWRAVSGPDPRSHLRAPPNSARGSHSITSAVKKMRMGLSATATFAANHACVASAETLSIPVLHPHQATGYSGAVRKLSRTGCSDGLPSR